MTVRSRLLIAGVMTLAIADFSTAAARERLIRRFDHRHGLPVSSVFSLGQDALGFLWIGTPAGLVRYDGIEMRLWTDRKLEGIVERIATGPLGDVVFTVSEDDRLYRVDASGASVFTVDGEPLREVRDATFDVAGDLWIVRGTTVERHELGRGPSAPALAVSFGEQPYRVVTDLQSGVLVVDRAGLWRITPAGGRESLLELRGIVDVQPHPDGFLSILRYDLERHWLLLELSNGRTLERFRTRERAIDLVLRGRTVWASFAQDLVAWTPGEDAERLGPDDAFEATGGPLLVDAEGSLWMGNFLGLFQFPEPDTVVWTEKDGLISRHTRFLARTREGTWVSTWAGLLLLEPDTGRSTDRPGHPAGRSPLCTDAQGRLWTLVTIGEGDPSMRRTGVLERAGGRTVVHDFEMDVGGTCTMSPGGTVWLSIGSTLVSTAPAGGRPQPLSTVPLDEAIVRALLETVTGTVWAGTISGDVCHGSPRDDPGDWTCGTLPGRPQVKGLVETPSGAIWAATSAGLFRTASRGWERVPGSEELPTSWLTWASGSPSGGIWITGHGSLVRVRERLDLAAGWEVVERIGVWQGLPTSGAEGLLEQPDGTLWVATSAGVVRIPANARSEEAKPPAVRLVDVRVDDERFPVGSAPRLPHQRNRVEISFAAMSYRDPGRVRYRVRARPRASWSESRQPSFLFVDLRPGAYRLEVVASLDGTRWSDEPAAFAFRILAPWYLRWWAITLWLLAAASLLYVIYRTRVAVVLRLERQRARIAMDLHDELGSGLGSIRILADLVRERATTDREQGRLSEQIGDSASELASSLSDIVWSLRRDSGSIEALATQLAERGARMFPEGEIEFITEFPGAWPDVPLGLAIRRNLQRIGVEALHNVAKHAGARRVRLGFGVDGSRWAMWVEDDGCGLPHDPQEHGVRGLGLTSMRARAGEVGADITWTEPTGGGTRVEVRFDPGARGRVRVRGTP